MDARRHFRVSVARKDGVFTEEKSYSILGEKLNLAWRIAVALPKIVLTANTKSAESDSGRFVRVWEDEPETFVLLTRRRFSGEIRTKTGGVLMPHSDEDNFKLQNHEVVFRIIRGQFGAQKQTVFMTQEVANFLVPLMATPTLAIDLTDVSVGRSLIDTVTRTLSTNLHLPK